MEKIIGWGLAAVAAVVTIVLVSRSGSEAKSPSDLCLAKLPEPFKTQAIDIVKAGDVDRMESFAAQCDAKGWHCAGKELRAEAKKAVPEPYRSEWKKLIARAQAQAAIKDQGSLLSTNGQLVVDLQSAMIEARKRGYTIASDLQAAIGLLTPRINLTEVREQPFADDIKAAFASSDLPGDLDRLVGPLTNGGYARAAAQARETADGTREEKKKAVPGYVSPPPPPPPPSNPLDSLPPDVRALVDAAYASGDPQQLDDVAADYLISYLAAYTKVKADAAEIRDRLTMPLSAFPGLAGGKTALALVSVSDELGAPWLLSYPQYIWPSITPWVITDGSEGVSGWNVSNALLARGYKQAAIDTGTLWGVG